MAKVEEAPNKPLHTPNWLLPIYQHILFAPLPRRLGVWNTTTGHSRTQHVPTAGMRPTPWCCYPSAHLEVGAAEPWWRGQQASKVILFTAGHGYLQPLPLLLLRI